MPQCHDRSSRRPSRQLTSLSVIIGACVVLLSVDLTVAFPTVGLLSSRTTNSCFSSCKSICSEREYHLSCAGFGVGRHTQQFRKTKRSSSQDPLHAKSKAYSDSQDEFQRSLLAAKIANDIKGTEVKEESHRQERVEKQIVKEKEKLEAAVKEVQEAAQNVTQSAKTLGGAVISNSTEVKDAVVDVSQSARSLGGAVIFNGLGIVTRFLTTLLGSEEFRKDILRRRSHYLSDWTDGFKRKRQVIPAVLFLYFACLAPAVSFGTIASEITNGSIGVVEFLLGSGMAGMMYSIFSGQPMAFLAPTGLTLAFTSGLFRFCSLRQMSFFPVYAWVGIWTSFFMTLLGVAGSSKLIRYCTRFTDEVFNGLLSVNFIYEAVSSLRRNFMIAHRNDPMNLTMPFVALSMALGTFLSTMKVVKFEATKFFNTKVRTQIKNFGPVTVILTFTLLNLLPWFKKFHVPTLTVPDTFQLAGGRNFLVGLTDIPTNYRMLCALPALLLTALFFMDQNISVRLVNSPDNKLKKGPAYNLDMVALGVITGVLSIFGLPWMCGATVQSMNHVRAMSATRLNPETNEIEIERVTETRLTGFIIHAMLASTVMLLPLIKTIPIPVVSGVFLFLGRKLMTGNSFLKRITDAFAERRRLPDNNPINLLGRKKTLIYTGVQVLCLLGLFGFKQISSITIFFPAMIGVLMSIRAFVLPKIFSEDDFVALGDPTPEWQSYC